MSGFPWASAVVLIPLMGGIVCGVVPLRRAAIVGLTTAVATVAATSGLGWRVWHHGSVSESPGGWGAPLGIDLVVDGMAALLVLTTAVVGFAISLFSVSYYAPSQTAEEEQETHHQGFFWSLWLVVWAALNGVFISSDLFNLYVCLEVISLSSVALVGLTGTLALRAAMRYLLVTLCGSLLYLIGVALLYGGWGVLDVQMLASAVDQSMASQVALVAMTLGLALKTALVPLHFWLPAAHANAPAPVSAALSGLVIKASFIVLLRLWSDVFGALDKSILAAALTVLAMTAIIWGSVQALRQTRLKMLIAYSTVAQVGYLFVAFAPDITAQTDPVALQGALVFVAAHACAKAAMFLAAGALAISFGDDCFSSMNGQHIRLIAPFIIFILAGYTLIGLPYSGGGEAKYLLSSAVESAGLPVVGWAMTAGKILATLYVLKVLYHIALPTPEASESIELRRITVGMIAAGLLLSVVAVGLGPASAHLLQLLEASIGTALAAPHSALR